MRMAFGILVNDMDRFKKVFLSQYWCQEEEIFIKENPESAAKGLNLLLSKMREEDFDVAVLIHQDVELPFGWKERTIKQLEKLPDFILAGVCGVDEKQCLAGHIRDGREVYTVCTKPLPTKAKALDECCLIVNLHSNFQFNEEMTGFHLYGTEAVLRNDNAFIIDSMLYHMSTRESFVMEEDKDFMEGWKYLEGKYPEHLITSTSKNCIYAFNRRPL